MSTMLPIPQSQQFVTIGREATYTLRREEQLQYGVQSVSASIQLVHTLSCVDLNVTLGGNYMVLKNVTRDANGAPGTWDAVGISWI